MAGRDVRSDLRRRDVDRRHLDPRAFGQHTLVDIITCNDEGRIIEFRVMIRPLQAIQTIHAQMAAMLEKMDGKR